MADRPFPELLRSHRQARGVSQLALGVQTGLSQKHVSFLETGRSQPGRSVVLRLAEGLALAPGQRDRFLRAAGFAPVPDGAMALDGVESVAERILAQYDPYPAVLLDTAQNVHRMNRSLTALLGMAGPVDALWQRTCGTGPRNMLRLGFHQDGLFPHMVDAPRLVPALLDRMLKDGAGDPELCRLIDEILDWPHIRALGAPAPGAALDGAVFEERYRLGDIEIGLICLMTVIGTPFGPLTGRMRLEFYCPADTQTEALLQAL
ncbi:MAG: helix-turn-helix domain-containing protein [Alphaproteobacteria bacterium]